MELVYLWVEEYKNIKNQRFNFSPRFTCEYDEDKNELTIEEKKDYVSIFPDKINVTAIVGENGSGKSGLLEEIFNIVSSKIIVIFINNKFYMQNSDELHINNTTPYKSIPFKELNFHKKSLQVHSDFLKVYDVIDAYTYGNQGTEFSNLYYQMLHKEDSALLDLKLLRQNVFKLIFTHYEVFKSDIFMYRPIQILITTPQLEFKHKISFDLSNEDNNDELLFRIGIVEKIIETLVQEANDSEDILDKLYVYLLLKYIRNIKNIEDLNQLDIYDASLYVNQEEESHYKIEDFEEAIRKRAFQDKELVKEAVGHAKERKIEAYEYMCNKLTDDLGKATEIEDFYDLISTHENEFFTLNKLGFFNIDFLDETKRRFFDLSHGERKFFTDSLILFDAIIKKQETDLLICLDEPDVSLHPQWQKKYIDELIKMLSKIDKKIHFIITSHSPFILSDVPKENIIFLKKGTDGNCKNITEETNIETFGANIHSLLSHGFFMNDGLIGDFAKEKINKAIEYLNKKKITKKEMAYCTNIISIIGEPILKSTLQAMLHSKETKLDKLKRQQKAIEEAIKREEQKVKLNDKN